MHRKPVTQDGRYTGHPGWPVYPSQSRRKGRSFPRPSLCLHLGGFPRPSAGAIGDESGDGASGVGNPHNAHARDTSGPHPRASGPLTQSLPDTPRRTPPQPRTSAAARRGAQEQGPRGRNPQRPPGAGRKPVPHRSTRNHQGGPTNDQGKALVGREEADRTRGCRKATTHLALSLWLAAGRKATEAHRALKADRKPPEATREQFQYPELYRARRTGPCGRKTS